jgi:cadmium resistance protein CadD (predicted permease)
VSSLPASAATAVALFAATNVDDLVVLALFSAASRATGRPRRWEIWAGQYLGFATLVGLSLAVGRGLSLILSRWLWLLALIPLAVGVVTLVAAIRQARHPGQSAPPPHAPPGQTDPPQPPGSPGARGPSDAADAPGVDPADPPQPPASPGARGPSDAAHAPGVVGPSDPADLPRVPAPSAVADPSDPSGAVGVRGLSAVPGIPAVPGVLGVRGLSWMAGVAGVATLTVVNGADNLAAYTPVFATADADRIAVTLTVFAVGVAVWCEAGALLTRHHRITDTLARYGRWILPTAFILIALYTLHATNAPIHP